WGVNNLYPHIPRANRWFEIHHIHQEGGNYYRRGDRKFRGQDVNEYLTQLGEWTAKQDCAVYMQQHWDIVPTSIAYPIEDIIKAFGRYFTNSISYQLALAIAEDFEEIHVYGVDMAVDTEYNHQRPSCEFFLGIAAGRGITVHIPNEADLLKTRFMYGFEEPLKTAWDKKGKAMKKTTKEKMARLNREIDQIRAEADRELRFRENQIQQYIGADHALQESNKIWS
ncbi:MAG: hypothetical protein MJA29_04315, partial [Candidatus Omnitrophica bacterium]|nr:hypothetical protein [Candidatus Omnitrophota bacterium]